MSEPDRIQSGRPARFWLGLAAGLAVIGLGGWALTTSGGGSSDGAAAGDTASPTTGSPPTERSTTTRRPTTSTTSADSSAGDPTPTTEASAWTTRERTAAGEFSGPLLGRPVGWSLAIGDMYNDVDLELLDLDTGYITSYSINGGPVAVDDGRLVLARHQFESTPNGASVALDVVDLADPSQSPRTFADELVFWGWSGSTAILDSSRHAIWVLAQPTDDTVSWQLLDLDDGSSIDEVAFSDPPSAYAVTFVAGQLTASSDGGIFERQDGVFRRVADGTIQVASDRFALVRQCAAPDACALRWLDTSTWQSVDRALPTDSITWASYLSPGGRFVVFGSGNGAMRTVIFDVERQEELDLGLNTFDGLAAVAVTPDDRYLAVQTSGQVVLYDVENRRRATVDQANSGGSNLLFVPRDVAG